MLHHKALLEPAPFRPPEASRKEGQRQSLMAKLDTFNPARCPVCRRELVARMCRGGPGFACDCKTKP